MIAENNLKLAFNYSCIPYEDIKLLNQPLSFIESMQAGRLRSSNLLKNALLLSANKNILPERLEVLLLWMEEFPVLLH